jgi:hypothetical protein
MPKEPLKPMVAILDLDLEPISLTSNVDLLKHVAQFLAWEKERNMPAPRTHRYAVERERLQLLRLLGGLDMAADLPPDAMAAWKHLEDTAVLPEERDQ